MTENSSSNHHKDLYTEEGCPEKEQQDKQKPEAAGQRAMQQKAMQQKAMQDKRPLELYLHIPFCIRKCHYCDFLSAPAERSIQDRYMAALLKELQENSRDYQEYRVVSVFFGGGTPSVVAPEWIESLMEAVRSLYDLEEDAEITMEINPGTVDWEQLVCYRRAGINRLSIGLQSASDKELRLLGRIHTFSRFLETYYEVRRAGFTNVNVDLMSALPDQTPASWQETLQKVLALDPPPEHISAYSLIIEEGTLLYRLQQERKLNLPDEESDRQMYALTEALLKKQGYHRYEISNYAREGYECRHNCGYWQRTEYLGLGLGAASLIGNRRFHNGSSLQEYMDHPLGCREDIQILSINDQMEEFMFLGLRMTRGVSEKVFQESFSRGLQEVYGEVISQNLRDGLLEEIREDEETIYRLTSRGTDLSNYVMAQFLL